MQREGGAAAAPACNGRPCPSVRPTSHPSLGLPHLLAVGASDAMSIVADCYFTLMASAQEGGRATKAVPAFMRSGYPRAGSTASLAQAGAAPSSGGGASVPAGAAMSQHEEQQQQQAQQPEAPLGTVEGAGLPPLQPHRSRNASAESFFAPDAGPASWAGHQAVESLGRTSSADAEGAALPHLQHGSGSGSSQENHWNPHGQLSSEECEAAAAAAVAWEQAAGGWPPAALRSRSTSVSSLLPAGPSSPALPSRDSSSSLASATAGGSLHGGSQHGALAAADALRRQGSSGANGSNVSPAGSSPQPKGLGEAAAGQGLPGQPAGPAGGRASPQQQQQQQPRPASAGGARPKPGGASGAAGAAGAQKQKVRVTLRLRPREGPREA